MSKSIKQHPSVLTILTEISEGRLTLAGARAMLAPHRIRDNELLLRAGQMIVELQAEVRRLNDLIDNIPHP